jgi:hypothetical protein
MEAIKQQGPQPKGKKEQNQVVNEQDQLEKINPGDEDFQSEAEKNSENSGNTFNKRNQPDVMENQAGLEEGNTYEDDPKRGENKMPVN